MHLRRMQSPTDPAGRTGTIGVEAFDATYGAGFEVSDDSAHAVECELVEDGGAFVAHQPTDANRPRRLAFVDGTLRTEARLTRTGPAGDVSMGLAGSWAAGAVLVDGDEPARFDQVTTGRAAIFTGGRPDHLPDHRDGWRWEPYAVDGTDVEAARQQLQRLMRDAEADIAEVLSNEGWLTVLDGPLHGIRHHRGLTIIGYVKTHHRRMLAREHWVRVPELTAGERSGLFAMEDALYGCYLRVGDPGPWAGAWAGIARLEMPSGIGRDAAVEAADRAAGWLPGFASALHRDARAPVRTSTDGMISTTTEPTGGPTRRRGGSTQHGAGTDDRTADTYAISFSFLSGSTFTEVLAGLAFTSIVSPGRNGFGTFFRAPAYSRRRNRSRGGRDAARRPRGRTHGLLLERTCVRAEAGGVSEPPASAAGHPFVVGRPSWWVDSQPFRRPAIGAPFEHRQSHGAAMESASNAW